MISAPVIEVFRSRQGEGLCVGDPMLFVRFGGCNVRCDYCDTPNSIPIGSGVRQTIDELVSTIGSHRSRFEKPVVSLTGGEPLLHAAFLQQLCPILKEDGWQIYLETNGTLPQQLEKVWTYCDWVAMDLKPVSAITHDMQEAHRWFLIQSGNKVFVKLILTATTAEHEFKQSVMLLEGTRPDTPLVLQPATAVGSVASIPLDRLVSWWMWASQRLPNVRILPQIHPLWEEP